jgi:predicted amidophosphoribosyltransferase
VSTIFFRTIDDQSRPDHVYLEQADQCLYLEEYTSRQKYDFSAGNNLISNLKKKQRKGGQHYKSLAIRTCSQHLCRALNSEWIKQAVIVPVPPSKMKGDPEYDDRMLRVALGIATNVNVRELVVQNRPLAAFHETEDRPNVATLLTAYDIDEKLVEPAPRLIGILDDVLTCGTHFKAIQRLLKLRFPEAKITGLFIARRVFPPEETDFEPLSF